MEQSPQIISMDVKSVIKIWDMYVLVVFAKTLFGIISSIRFLFFENLFSPPFLMIFFNLRRMFSCLQTIYGICDEESANQRAFCFDPFRRQIYSVSSNSFNIWKYPFFSISLIALHF